MEIGSKNIIIQRYDENIYVSTQLNKMEAITSWISSLRSVGYTSDILKQNHNFNVLKEIKECSKLISNYADCSMGLLEQANSGPPEMSFLPLYYSLLSLSKIIIILSGNKNELLKRKNKYHGASYSHKKSYDLLNEQIILKQNGTIPLFYKSLTKESWDINNKIIKMGSIYPLIRGVSHEFSTIYKEQSLHQFVRITLNGNDTTSYFLRLIYFPNASLINGGNLRYLKVVKRFNSVSGKEETFESMKYKTHNKESAISYLQKYLRRHLICSEGINPLSGEPITLTPVSNKRLLFPEEFSIMLAFFHLSNVVRYNPEFLFKLKDQKSWGMLLNLRRDSIYRFLVLFWSYLHQSNLMLSG